MRLAAVVSGRVRLRRRTFSHTEFSYNTTRLAQSDAADQADTPAESGQFRRHRYVQGW